MILNLNYHNTNIIKPLVYLQLFIISFFAFKLKATGNEYLKSLLTVGPEK